MPTDADSGLAALAEKVRGAVPDATAEGIVSVYLFGSRAAAREHRESDVDLGILFDRRIFPSARERFEARLRLFGHLAPALRGVPLDLVILNDAPPELARNVVTRGRRLLCADPETDHAFVRDVQLRAADLAPFLRRKRATKLEAIGR